MLRKLGPWCTANWQMTTVCTVQCVQKKNTHWRVFILHLNEYKYVSREFIQCIKCDTSNALCVLVLWKQPSFKQTSETVSAKQQIMQIIAQWVPGSWAGNRKCPTPIWAQTVSRHNEVMMPGRTKMLSTGHISHELWNQHAWHQFHNE